MTSTDLGPFSSGDETATVSSTAPTAPPTRTIAELVDDVGWLNSRTGLHVADAAQLHAETAQLHFDALDELVRTRASALAGQPTSELLDRLARVGFAWRDVARVVGVSVPALRKWRQGATATGPNRLRVAWLVAVCELLEEKALITDVPSWLEVPLLAGVPIRRLDMLAADRSDLVFSSAMHHGSDPEDLLDEFSADWRSTYDGNLEVFIADDGLPGLRPRDSDG